MAVQFASIEDFYAYLGVTPPVEYDDLALDAALTRMSARIARATRLARVSYLPTGIPSSTTIAAAFARATAAELASTGAVVDGEVDSDVLSGVGAEWDSISMIGVSFSKNNKAAGSAGSGTSSANRLSTAAADELAAVNIFTTAVRN